MKDIKDLNLEELWDLFPIVIKGYNPLYPVWYEEEKDLLIKCLKDYKVLRINHIGSTAVKGLASKAIVDILCECDSSENLKELSSNLEENKWILMNEDNPKAVILNKGYTKQGYAEKVFHLHLRHIDNWHELYFRDYLIDHPKICKKYEKLKQRLALQFKHHRENYTDAKTEFIQKYTALAQIEYKDRYKAF